MKKKNKSPNQKKSTKALLLVYLVTIKNILKARGVILMFFLAGAAIGFALIRSQGYINPTRDEAKYQELSAGVTYSKIDYTLVKKLESALSDTDVTVSQNLSPNRSNPFSE